MSTPGRRVSMADVARAAGVSAQTVSRVSNGHPSVVAATRDRVLTAMGELGYRPNSAARALKRGDFRTLGVLLFTLATTGNVRTLEAISAAAAEEGYAVTLLPVATPTRDDLRGAFTRFGELAVDGAVVLMDRPLRDAAALDLPPGIPVVVTDPGAGGRHRVVDTDQAAGARAAVRHLLAAGHETVWHLAGPRESFAAERRAAGWRAELRASGRRAPRLVRGDWSALSGYQAGRRLARLPECTAVFAANDQMALGLLRALGEAGRRVPADVSVTGFDDVDEAASYRPPLTTIRQDFAEVGQRCVAGLLAQIHGTGPTTGSTLVPATLVVRASTAPPPQPS